MKQLGYNWLTAGLLILVLISVSIPSYMWYSLNKSRENVELAASIHTSLIQQYGTNARLVQIQSVNEIYLIKWEDADNIHASLWLDGIMTEIARIPRKGGN